MEEQNKSVVKRFFTKKGNVAVVVTVAVCLLALIAGVIMNIVLHANGKLGDAEFSHRMLFILNTLGGICIVFAAELILRVRFPVYLEIAAVLFGFSATGLATVYGFYELVYEWDSVLHTVSGCMFALTGLCLANLIFRDKLAGAQAAVASVLFALFFSLSVGYLWEIFEYVMDSILPNSDLQPYDVSLLRDAEGNFATIEIDGQIFYYTSSLRGSGLLDTMRDMIVHLLGSLAVLIPLFILFLKKPSAQTAFSSTVYPWWNKIKKKNPATTEEAPDTTSEEL